MIITASHRKHYCIANRISRRRMKFSHPFLVPTLTFGLFLIIFQTGAEEDPSFGISSYCQPCKSACVSNLEKEGKHTCSTKEWSWRGTIYHWDYCSATNTVDFLGRNCTSECAFHGQEYQWCNATTSWGHCSNSDGCKSMNSTSKDPLIPETTIKSNSSESENTADKSTSTTPSAPVTAAATSDQEDHHEEIESEDIGDLSIRLPKDYASYQLPILDSAQFVPVFVSIYITSVADIDEKEELLILNTNFARRWLDYKISSRVTGPIRNVTLGAEALEKLWTPDIFFDGSAPVEKDTAEATPKTLRVIFNTSDIKDAQIAFSERSRLKLDCSMDFRYYPADTQVCTYYIRSFSYKQHNLKLFWEPLNSVFLRDPTHPNFDLLVDSVWPDLKVNGSDKLFVEEDFDPFRRGNYSAITFTVKARRKLSYHLVQTCLPSVLLILMTWMCFLIPAEMVEARIGISMTTVLTLTAMFASVREQAPSVSYKMAIDIWMVFCIFVVFVALLLFTFTYWVGVRRSKKEKKSEESLDLDLENESVQHYKMVIYFNRHFAFAVFALGFISFVVIYWWWLLTYSGYLDWNPKEQYNAMEDDEDGSEGATFFHFYRYFNLDAMELFDSSVYHPSAYETLKRVFGLSERPFNFTLKLGVTCAGVPPPKPKLFSTTACMFCFFAIFCIAIIGEQMKYFQGLHFVRKMFTSISSPKMPNFPTRNKNTHSPSDPSELVMDLKEAIGWYLSGKCIPALWFEAVCAVVIRLRQIKFIEDSKEFPTKLKNRFPVYPEYLFRRSKFGQQRRLQAEIYGKLLRTLFWSVVLYCDFLPKFYTMWVVQDKDVVKIESWGTRHILKRELRFAFIISFLYQIDYMISKQATHFWKKSLGEGPNYSWIKLLREDVDALMINTITMAIGLFILYLWIIFMSQVGCSISRCFTGSTKTIFYNLGVMVVHAVFKLTLFAIFFSLMEFLLPPLVPIPDPELKRAAERICATTGFPASDLHVCMDAGPPNAFTMSFFGLKQKIVFIGSTSYEWGRRRRSDEDDEDDDEGDDRRGNVRINNEECLAILCHEIGHWHHSHVESGIITNLVLGGLGYSAADWLRQQGFLFEAFGFLPDSLQSSLPVLPGYFICNDVVLSGASMLFAGISNAVGSLRELQADRFAVGFQLGAKLQNGLAKLFFLEEIFPMADWVYKTFFLSHPPLVDRIDALDKEMYGQ